MAGAGYKLFNTGDVLTAAQVNTYLMQQTVMVFADASARTTALSSVLAEGMISYLKSTDATEVYNGSAWVAIAADQTPLTTKGDLFTYTTTDARLASSNVNGDVLTVDTSTASGLKWAALPASGGMTLIQETVASANSSISFSSISGSYKQLHLVYSGIRHSTTGSDFSVRFNNSSSAIYHINGPQFLQNAYPQLMGSSPTSLSGQNSPYNIYSFGTSVTNANISTDVMGYIIIDNYASTTKAKTIQMAFGFYRGDGSGGYMAVNTTGVFDSTSAITSVDIVRLSGSATISNTTNTSIRLYGVN